MRTRFFYLTIVNKKYRLLGTFLHQLYFLDTVVLSAKIVFKFRYINYQIKKPFIG